MEGVQVRRAWPGVAGLLLLALGACGANDGKTAKYRLEGSVSQVMDLGYDEVRVQPSEEDIAVSFVRVRKLGSTIEDAGSEMAGVSEDYPFKVTVKLWGEPPFGGVRVNLAEVDLNDEQRGKFSRNVLNDPRRDFPRAVRSTLYLDRAPTTPGAKIHGDFNVTFENGIEAASGRTVFGTFDAKVVQ